ncbi:MAG: zinc metalloprotease HtpX [Burkholderiales bacterium]
MAEWHRHAAANRLQTLLLVVVLLGISAVAGGLLFGETGLWVALGASLMALVIEPVAVSRLTLAWYRARPLTATEAPDLWRVLHTLAARAGLPAVPVPHYVPSPLVNAFAVGNRRDAAIALTDGLLRTLSARELVGVLAHETAHIAHDDLRVMGLADYVSRLTALFALAGQISLLASLPWWLVGAAEIRWPGLLLLLFSPQLALLAQLGLSRVREFDADLAAARLTGDPEALASALVKIERVNRSWRAWLLPGWGNPEPSWLRTHPATEERIERLRVVSRAAPEALWEQEHPLRPGVPSRNSPRWYPGGVWR